jgi:3-oxoacyl-[acyl-carrier-protein] synthase I
VPGHAAAITALGANTSLGGAVTACAASRARLARPAPLQRVALDPDEGSAPVVGHPVPTVMGFHGDARLLSLALPALREFVTSSHPEAGTRAALCVAVPDVEARARAAGAEVPPRLRFADRLVEASGLTVAPDLRIVFPFGQAGFGLAMEAAAEILAQGRADVCVVGGVDTLCDDLALAALAEEDRLKTGDNPVGLQPGEAAAFLLLEPLDAARRRKAPVLGVVAGFALAHDPRDGQDPPIGEGLAEALRQLAAVTGPFPVGETWFLLDRNGEAVRANDWGYCQQRLMASMHGLLPAAEWDLAITFGDTGAASGALAAQAAVRGFARGYAPGRCAVVLSSSDGGQRAAVRIERWPA